MSKDKAQGSKPKRTTTDSTRKTARTAAAASSTSKKSSSRKGVGGRPSTYTPEKAALICEELATGKSIRQICAEHKGELPDKSTIFRWLYRHPEFRDQYMHAKHLGMIAYAEEAIEIADDSEGDWIEKLDKDGNPTGQMMLDHEHVQRSRLRVDTRKWFMERLAPKTFGAKVDMNHGVQEDNPIVSLFQQIAGATLKPKESDEN